MRQRERLTAWIRQIRRTAELKARGQPAALSAALSKDARERGCSFR